MSSVAVSAQAGSDTALASRAYAPAPCVHFYIGDGEESDEGDADDESLMVGSMSTGKGSRDDSMDTGIGSMDGSLSARRCSTGNGVMEVLVIFAAAGTGSPAGSMGIGTIARWTT